MASSFTILSRIEGTATILLCSRVTFGILLSVSSIGSSELQRSRTGAIRRCSAAFQYPLSDRVNCNTALRVAMAESCKSFQYPLADRVSCNLGQVVWNSGLIVFHYPLSDRVNCNQAAKNHHWPCCGFQYPLS